MEQSELGPTRLLRTHFLCSLLIPAFIWPSQKELNTDRRMLLQWVLPSPGQGRRAV